MKKLLPLLLIMIMISSLLLTSCGKADENTGDGTNVNEGEQTPTVIENSCICGREYHIDNGEGYFAYDCVKCKKNYLLCTCNCFCGEESYTTEENPGQKYCKGCEKPCVDCICADRATALLLEKQISEGKISHLGISKPSSVFAIIISIFAIFGLSLGGIHCMRFVKTTEFVKEKKIKDKPKKVENDKPKKISVKEKAVKNHNKEEEYDYEQTSSSKKKNISSMVKWPINGRLPAICSTELVYSILAKRQNANDSLSLFNQLSPMELTTTQLKTLAEYAGVKPNKLTPIILPEELEGEADFPFKDKFTTIDEYGIRDISEEGKKFAYNVLIPEKAIYVSRKMGKEYTLSLFEGLWTIIYKNEEGNYLIAPYIEEALALSFVKAGVCGFKKSENSPEHIDIGLDYNQWYLLLLSLFENPHYFTPEQLRKGQKASFLKRGLSGMDLEDASEELEEFLANENKVSEAIESLKEQDIFEENDNGLGLSPLVIEWFNTRDVNDTVFFDSKSVEADNLSTMFISKAIGALCIYDTGKGVRIMSSKRIPWKAYIR